MLTRVRQKCYTLMPVFDKQQICSGRSWKLKSQFLVPLGNEGMGRMEDSRGNTKRGVTKKAKRAILLSLPALRDAPASSVCGMSKDSVKWILLFLTMWFVRVGLKHIKKEVGI